MKRNGGFTLIELLVVIGILGILMAMMIPGAGMIMKKSKTATARTGAMVVQTALQRYRMEYNRWPSFAKDKPPPHFTDSDFMDTMAPLPTVKQPPVENLKKIVFIEVSKGAATKVSESEEKYEYRDPWGKPYQYLVNETPKDTIDLKDKEAFKQDYDGPKEIRAKVLVWSAGPDGDYETWKDNVGSWEY